MTPDEIEIVLDKHAKWLLGREGGELADLRGANLSGANLSYSDLRGANLSYSDLRYSNLRGADLRGANLRYSDLRYSNLRYSNLSDANLSGSDLSGSDLSGADLRDAKYPHVPIIPDIHRAILAACTAPGCALNMGAWHTCDTTHCRAGWIVHLAGGAGKTLEAWIGTPAAAALIYQSSDPTMERVPDWYATNEEAMADMRRLAGVTAAEERAP